jgi:hypothetical protein
MYTFSAFVWLNNGGSITDTIVARDYGDACCIAEARYGSVGKVGTVTRR